MSQLTKTRFAELVEKCRSHMGGLANILHEIWQDELWKDGGYKSFEQFAKAEFNYGKSYAYELIKCEQARLESGIPDCPPSSQLRELVKIEDPEQRAEVYQEVKDETDGKPTAAAIKQKVEELQPVGEIYDDVDDLEPGSTEPEEPEADPDHWKLVKKQAILELEAANRTVMDLHRLQPSAQLNEQREDLFGKLHTLISGWS